MSTNRNAVKAIIVKAAEAQDLYHGPAFDGPESNTFLIVLVEEDSRRLQLSFKMNGGVLYAHTSGSNKARMKFVESSAAMRGELLRSRVRKTARQLGMARATATKAVAFLDSLVA